MKNKKSASTNDLYQSTFMPIFQDAETKIKKIILIAFLLMLSVDVLMTQIKDVIKDVDKQIPKDLKDRQNYINGLWMKSNVLIKKYYQKPKLDFIVNRNKVVNISDKTPTKIDTPAKLVGYETKNKQQIDMWSEQKGVPHIENYAKKIKEYENALSNEVMTTSEPGKKPISLWQKAELDVRHDHQMKMLEDLKAQGVEYAWTSTHPNCSKRCEKWQGKLMSLTEPSTMSGFRVKKMDGHWVYSLTEIMAQTDKYGYQNNIINGFNCRHHLIPYKKGTLPPREYTAQEIKRQRLVEERIREMERDIRKKKSKLSMLESELKIYNKINDKLAKEVQQRIKNLKAHIQQMTDYYKSFCERYGYAWYEYRIS